MKAPTIPTVTQHGSQGVALSTNVAEVFGKMHKDVLRLIDKKSLRLEQLGRISRRYFTPRDYIDSRGKQQRLVEMTRIGFDYLVLSFTGKRADEYKLKYIDMFYVYEQAALKIQANKANIEWQAARLLGKQTHHEYTEQGKSFLEYAAIQRGNDGYAKHFYSNLARAKLKALFAFPLDVKPARDLISPKQLRRLEGADHVADVALLAGMRNRYSHKVIYKNAVESLHIFAEISGGVEPVVIEPANDNESLEVAA